MRFKLDGYRRAARIDRDQVQLCHNVGRPVTLHNVEPFWVQFIQGGVIFLAVLFDSLNQKRRGG